MSDSNATLGLGSTLIHLGTVGVSADRVSKLMLNGFANAAASGKALDLTIQGLSASLDRMALQASSRQLNKSLGSLVNMVVQGLGSFASAGTGGLSAGGFALPGLQAFADGGIVAQPTFFGSASGPGLMGERGAEAILPLARGPDGRLGVAAQAGSGNAPVTINISTPDPQSFRQSQVQVMSALARAVSRGQRGL